MKINDSFIIETIVYLYMLTNFHNQMKEILLFIRNKQSTDGFKIICILKRVNKKIRFTINLTEIESNEADVFTLLSQKSTTTKKKNK